MVRSAGEKSWTRGGETLSFLGTGSEGGWVGSRHPLRKGGRGDQTNLPPVTCLQPCTSNPAQKLVSLRPKKGPNRGRRRSWHRSDGGGQERVGGWGQCTRGMGLRADGGHDTSKMWCGCFGKEGQFWKGKKMSLS